MKIEITGWNCVWTITFLNNAQINPTPVVWVCENIIAYENALKKLQGMDYIKIVQNGQSHIEPETNYLHNYSI